MAGAGLDIAGWALDSAVVNLAEDFVGCKIHAKVDFPQNSRLNQVQSSNRAQPQASKRNCGVLWVAKNSNIMQRASFFCSEESFQYDVKLVVLLLHENII